MWLTLVHPSKPFDAMYTLFMAVVFFQFGSCLVLSFVVFALVRYFLFLLSLFILSSFPPYVQLCFIRSFVTDSFGVWLLLDVLMEDFLPSDCCLFLSFTFQEGS